MPVIKKALTATLLLAFFVMSTNVFAMDTKNEGTALTSIDSSAAAAVINGGLDENLGFMPAEEVKVPVSVVAGSDAATGASEFDDNSLSLKMPSFKLVKTFDMYLNTYNVIESIEILKISF
ncbi:MAG TPA: hypothetical protein VJM57_06735 [Thermodesulfobacteriota bacterium]|nr:hypothetical protein [Thermodesulfobacteriota bacterium]